MPSTKKMQDYLSKKSCNNLTIIHMTNNISRLSKLLFAKNINRILI